MDTAQPQVSCTASDSAQSSATVEAAPVIAPPQSATAQQPSMPEPATPEPHTTPPAPSSSSAREEQAEQAEASPASSPNTSPKPKRPRTSLNERLAKIAKRKAALEKAEARLAAEARKERTGQLIAWGIWVEHHYKTGSDEYCKTIEDLVFGYLKDRNLERAKAGFARVRGSKKNSEPEA